MIWSSSAPIHGVEICAAILPNEFRLLKTGACNHWFSVCSILKRRFVACLLRHQHSVLFLGTGGSVSRWTLYLVQTLECCPKMDIDLPPFVRLHACGCNANACVRSLVARIRCLTNRLHFRPCHHRKRTMPLFSSSLNLYGFSCVRRLCMSFLCLQNPASLAIVEVAVESDSAFSDLVKRAKAELGIPEPEAVHLYWMKDDVKNVQLL